MNKKKRVFLLSSIIVIFVAVVVFESTFVANVLSGRVHFPQEHVGAYLTLDDGQTYNVFRRLKIEGETQPADAYAVFYVRFKFKSFDIKINKALSMIPAIFLAGMDGFREKYWAVDESTDSFLGIYQWEAEELAENYPNSFLFRMMTKRSASGTLSYKTLPNTSLSQFIQKLVVQ